MRKYVQFAILAAFIGSLPLLTGCDGCQSRRVTKEERREGMTKKNQNNMRRNSY